MNGASQTDGPGRSTKEQRVVNKIHPTKVLRNLRFVAQECHGLHRGGAWAQERRLGRTPREIVCSCALIASQY